MYGFDYVEQYILPMFSLLEGSEPNIWVIMGDHDILYHHMIVERKYFNLDSPKRFVGLSESVLAPRTY